MVQADPLVVHHVWWLAKLVQVPTLKKELQALTLVGLTLNNPVLDPLTLAHYGKYMLPHVNWDKPWSMKDLSQHINM